MKLRQSSLSSKMEHEGEIGILPKHLKSISESIAYPLSKIANLSFEQWVFPTELKLSLHPRFTKLKTRCSSLTNLPFFAALFIFKILEHLMYNRLLKFINKNNHLNESQFGFRNNHSTFIALMVIVENLLTALDNGNCAVGLFLD